MTADREMLAGLAEQARRRLAVFVREAWPLVEPRPFVSGWHIDAICEHLEAVSAGEIRKLIINVPPRMTKSLTVAVLWPSWEWLTDPATRWLFASYSDQLATKHSLQCRRLVQSVALRSASGDGLSWAQRVGYRGMVELVGQDWEIAGDQNLKTRFENSEGGYRIATSVGGTATGDGGDRLVIDDPLKAEDARSDLVRKAANSWFDATWSTRLNDPVRSTHVVIMQRLHEQDLTGHLLARGGWEHLCLPGEYEPSHPFTWPGDPRTEPGESLDPVRLPPERLDEMRTELGSFGFAGQVQQVPVPAEGGLFKRGWWRRWTSERVATFLDFDEEIASWDMRFSDSQAASTSYVVGQLWGRHGADRYLLGQVRARLSFTETLAAVVALRQWRPGVRATLVERKANGAAVIDTLRSSVGGLIPVEPRESKEARAWAVQPQVEGGNVYLPAGEWIPAPDGFALTSVEEFVAELASFPSGAHDDQVDAMSQALAWLRGREGSVGWTDALQLANAAAAERRRWVDSGGTERWFDYDGAGFARVVAGVEPELPSLAGGRRPSGDVVATSFGLNGTGAVIRRGQAS